MNEPSVVCGPSSVSPATVKTYPMRFTGNTSEYLRLWLVNVALIVLTLGLYLPWAKVRARQYLFAHTWLDGHNFEYRARPWVLLRSYLLLGSLFLLYSLALNLQFSGWELVLFILVGLFVLAYPWLVRQSLRFTAQSTTHRGLHFSFIGPSRGAYAAYGLSNLAAAFSGGLALPWAWHQQRRYQLDHLMYGQARGQFRGEPGQFFILALKGLGAGLLAICLGVAMLIPALGLLGVIKERVPLLSQPQVSEQLDDAVGYGLLLLLYGFVWRYVRAAVMKYVLDNLELGGIVRTRLNINPWRLMWIGISNTVAQLLSLGLLSPWAQLRLTRYVIERLEVRTIASLNDFKAAPLQGEGALGEAASEVFDIQLGF